MAKNLKETVEWYNLNAEKYAKDTASNSDPENLAIFFSQLPHKPKVLDLGCGFGRDSQTFFNIGVHSVGLDLSENLLRIGHHHFPEIDLTEADFLHLPFADNNFDGLWANSSLLHLDSLSQAVAAFNEFYRVTRSQGIINVAVKETPTQPAPTDERHFFYFTASELAALAIHAGFQVLRIEIAPEIAKKPQGRPNVNWINLLALKN